MENREQQILAEIKDMMTSIRSQLELLDAKMLELQQAVDPEGYDNDPIELDLEPEEVVVVDDDLPFDDVEEHVAEVVDELVEEHETAMETEPEPLVDDLPVDQENTQFEEPEVEMEVKVEEVPEVEEPQIQQEEPVATAAAAAEEEEEEEEEEPVVEVRQEDDEDDDLPGIFDVPSVTYAAAQIAPKVKPSVADVMTDKQAWRTDMPGSPVKDVRSAISLNDRIIFINHLFDEDPIVFQNTIVKINSMENLDQVVEYITAEYPKWDMGSELVYRFMMAVRRRVK